MFSFTKTAYTFDDKEAEIADNSERDPKIIAPYHEHQNQFNKLCLVHAINMLVGSKGVATRDELDAICDTLANESDFTADNTASGSMLKWTKDFYNPNPHRSSFVGFGNYDINVAMYFLQNSLKSKRTNIKNVETLSIEWFDNRKIADEIIPSLSDNGLVGLLINVKVHEHVPDFVPVLGQARHWITIKRDKRDYWWELDSKCKAPALLDNVFHTIQCHHKKGGHIFLVKTKTEEEDDEKKDDLIAC